MSSPSFRDRIVAAAKDAGSQLDLKVNAVTRIPRRLPPRTVTVRWADLNPLTGAARWTVTVWWTPADVKDPDHLLADWAALFWRGLVGWCRIEAGPDRFEDDTPPTRGDDVVPWHGFSLVLEDAETPA